MWSIKHHTELTLHELYGILRLRNAVYIVELEKPVADTDGDDLEGDTFHAMLIDEHPTAANSTYDASHPEGNVIAYLRMRWNRATGSIKFRRVVVAENHRGRGVATMLMNEAEEWCRQRGITEIELAARIHLQHFYEALGFTPVGEKYFLAPVGVWHINMLKTLN